MTKSSPQKSPRQKTAYITLPIVLFIVVLGWYFYRQITWIEYQTDLGISKQARQNPYLAATIFLQDQGVTVHLERSLQAFDQPLSDQQAATGNQQTGIGDTLVLTDAYGSLSFERMQNLLTWVDQGGHLIASASNHFLDNIADVTDPLFEHFGVTVDRQNGAGIEQKVWELINRYGFLAGVAGDELCPMLGTQTRFSLSGDDAEIGVHFLSTDLLQISNRAPDAWVGDASFAYILQFDVGDGRVTLVSSLDLWKNSAIGCLDHAWLLWRLAPEDGRITLFSNFEFPGVTAVLWRHFDATIIIASLLLLLWLWYRGVRFGPIRETHAMQRRQLLEHIDASADFLWRTGQVDSLLRSARKQLLQHIRQQHPQLFKKSAGYSRYTPDPDVSQQNDALLADKDQSAMLTNRLAALLGLSAEQIRLALWQPSANNPQRITAILAAMRNLKEKL